uniref:Uncharacterized protein n=1 Tax=Opuntia streptacantha TaxID=393608 RepID=A0A7C9AW12_OPUST
MESSPNGSSPSTTAHPRRGRNLRRRLHRRSTSAPSAGRSYPTRLLSAPGTPSTASVSRSAVTSDLPPLCLTEPDPTCLPRYPIWRSSRPSPTGALKTASLRRW